MPLSEADTRAKLITPALHTRGWPEEMILREQQTPGGVMLWGHEARRTRGRTDYLLHAPAGPHGQPLPIALIEAKPQGSPPFAGMEQAKVYARAHHVPFAFSCNGVLFAEYCLDDGETRGPLPLSRFPAPDELLDRYAALRGLDLDAPEAGPLLHPPREGERHYQVAAARAVLERVARGEKRALLSLATGTGKTRIAVGILRALAEAGHVRALFVCDRDELRNQALSALHDVFGSDAAAATTRNPEHNARIIVATYQTLGVEGEAAEGEDGEPSYLERHYGENYFSHIVIDECHRSAWGKWREVLTRNSDAVQIGLTATPRQIVTGAAADDADTAEADAITRDNYEYFGEPVYEYGIVDGMEDGYLAAMSLVRSDIVTAGQLEREQGVERDSLAGGEIRDARTGADLNVADMSPRFGAGSIEQRLLLPDRVREMCADLFAQLVDSGGPEQKTLIFCVTDEHADLVAAAMGNLYAGWAAEQGRRPAEPYAFKCTAAGGRELLADLRSNQARAFVACTVELISTGVDVPCLRNIVFFRYLKSPILFHQMLGRGTRIHEPSGKLSFTVHDYTNASRLLDEPLAQRDHDAPPPGGEPGEERDPQRRFEVEGIEVRVEHGETTVGVMEGGRLRFVALREYGERIANRLLEDVAGLDQFRERWIRPEDRKTLVEALPEQGRSAEAYRRAAELADCDLYDVLAHAGWQQTPRPRVDRAERVREAAGEPIIRILAGQFGHGGTEALESTMLSSVPAVREAGGLAALGPGAMPDLKRRLLASDSEWSAP